MKDWSRLMTGIVAMILLMPAMALAKLSVEVTPKKVRQGDAFLIVVHGSPLPDNLEAIVFDRRIPLSPVGSSKAAGLASAEQTCKPGKYSVTLLAPDGSRTAQRSFEVTRASFPVDRLTLPEEKVTLSPEDAARAEREAALLAELWPQRSPLKWSGKFEMPLEGRMGTGFGARRILNGKEKSPHGGVDIKANKGTPVHAVSKGRVILIQELFYGGTTVVLDHGGGLFSYYMHLDDASVVEGSLVSKGDPIGHVGSTGRSTGPHLHMGMKLLGLNVNPLSVIQLDLPDSSRPLSESR